MPSKYEEIDLSKLEFVSINDRKSLVGIDSFTEPASLSSRDAEKIIDSIPPILAGNDFRSLIASLKISREKNVPRIWSMGAHPIKVGVSRHLIALMEAGFITHLATNGAGIIHDTEIAFFGHTSEDVSGSIHHGKFAVTRETGEIVNASIERAYRNKLGLGEATGKDIQKKEPQYIKHSLSAACFRLGIPFTVHVAIGTDVNHIHPSINGAALGDSSHRDFRIFCSSISKLNGGVIVNLGSAVIMPVIIEKAIAVARNLGCNLQNFDGYNLDFIKHYRSNLNPVQRAIESGGRGAHIVGHHELTIPLLSAILLAENP